MTPAISRPPPAGLADTMTIICNYCGNNAEMVSGDAIYPHRPDLYHRKFYRCQPCGAYVGCHEGTDKPLGRLANAELQGQTTSP